MALAQYNYPQPTGLQQLGAVMMEGADDYAKIQLLRQAEDRRRAQQLADMQDQRQFAVEQRDVERGFANTDRRENAVFAARLEALERARVAGLISAADFGQVAIEDAALAKLAQVEATEFKRKESALTNAQGELNQLVADRDTLSARDQKIADGIRQLQADYADTMEQAEPAPVTKAAVLARAAELAAASGVRLATVEPKRSEQLSAYTGQAKEELDQAAFIPAYAAQQRLKSISGQYNSLVREQGIVVDQLRNVRQTMNDLQRQFPIAPVRAETPAAVIAPPAADAVVPDAAPGIATEAERQTARDALRRPAAPQGLDSLRSRVFEGIDATQERPAASFSNPRVTGSEFIPKIVQPQAALTPGQAMGRRNDAVADTMRGAFTGVTNLFRPSSWNLNDNYLVYDPPARRTAEQLQNRLLALSDRESPTAASLRNRLLALPPLQPLTQGSSTASLGNPAFYP